MKEEMSHSTLSQPALTNTYAAMVEEADIGILVIQNNCCVFANPQVYRMSGYTEDELLLADIGQRLHPEDLKHALERIQGRLNGEKYEPRTIKIRLLHRSGEYRWIEARSVAIDWQGQPAVLAFVVDINERKQTEQYNAEQRALLDGIFNDSDLYISIIDVSEANEFTYRYVSRAFEKLNGIPSEQFIGLHPVDLVPAIRPEREEAINGMLRRCAATDQTISFEEPHTIKGKPVWWYVTLKPLKNNAGRVYRIIASVVDITRRKKYEARLKKYQSRLEELVRERTRQTERQSFRLQEAEGNLETLINSIPDGIIIIDSDDVIRFGNPAASRLLGVTNDSLIGVRFPSKLSEDEKELEITLESGEVRSLALSVVRTTWEDQLSRLVVFLDITQRKDHLEKIRSLSQRLLEVQEKDRREMGNILHDEIGGTITMLRLASDRVRRDMDGKSTPGLDDIDKIITELADQVRFISYSMRPTMLDDYGLEETLHWYIDRYRERTGIGITFTHKGLETRPPGQIETTAYRIIQEALTNITKHSGTEKITIDLSFRKGILTASVRDTGRGFDPASEKRGIGLRQMQDLAELAGGNFAVESAPGRGTTIGFCLPVPKS